MPVNVTSIWIKGAELREIPTTGKLALFGCHAMGGSTEIKVTKHADGSFRLQAFCARSTSAALDIDRVPEVSVERIVNLWTEWANGRQTVPEWRPWKR